MSEIDEDLDWTRVEKESYSSKLRDSSAWFAAADELQFAAELVRPRVNEWWTAISEWRGKRGRPRKFPPLGCHSIYMMLCAFVIENVLKGAILRDGAIQLEREPQGRLPRALAIHDLVRLARRAEFPFDVAQEELLARLSRASSWRGRYPLPVKYDAANDTVVVEGGEEYSTRWFGEADVGRTDQLIESVRKHFGVDRNPWTVRDASP